MFVLSTNFVYPALGLAVNYSRILLAARFCLCPSTSGLSFLFCCLISQNLFTFKSTHQLSLMISLKQQQLYQ
jgi:hypothetical protein